MNYGDPVAGVNVYADDGFGDYYSATTHGSGYYSMSVVDSTYDVSLDCGQLSSLGYQCPADGSVTVSGNSMESDFSVQLINTPYYSFATLHGLSAGDVNAVGFSPTVMELRRDGGLLLVSNTLYGTAAYGGTNGAGTIFAFGTNLNLISFALVHTLQAAFTKPTVSGFTRTARAASPKPL